MHRLCVFVCVFIVCLWIIKFVIKNDRRFLDEKEQRKKEEGGYKQEGLKWGHFFSIHSSVPHSDRGPTTPPFVARISRDSDTMQKWFLYCMSSPLLLEQMFFYQRYH